MASLNDTLRHRGIMQQTAEIAVPTMTESEAASALRLSLRTLQRYRQAGTGPAHTRQGPRFIRYAEADLQAWLERQRVEPK